MTNFNLAKVILKILPNSIKKELSDEVYLKLRYKARLGLDLDLENPSSLNEKFQWYKLNYREPLMTKCADKVTAREYVQECGLGHLLNEQYGVYDTFDEINFEELPDTFFLKCNHGSGSNILFRKSNMSEERKEELKTDLQKQLKTNYFWHGREWAYKDIVPKIICEKYLKSETDTPLIDLNFFCFNGSVELIYYNVGLADKETGKHSKGCRAVLNSSFEYMENAYTQMECLKKEQVFLPDNMDELKQYAEILSKPFPHARIDFFVIDGRAYFGEITFYSASGFMFLKPDEIYNKLGECFKLEVQK